MQRQPPDEWGMRGAAFYAMTWIWLASAGAPVEAAAVPLEVYGRLPSLEDVALSPDGSRIAFVRTTQDTRLIAVLSLVDNKVLGALRVTDQKLRQVAWADNNHLMIVTSATTLPWGLTGQDSEWQLLQLYDVISHKSVGVPDMHALSDVRMMNVVTGRTMVRHVGGHTVLYVTGLCVDRQLLLALFSFDVDTGIEKLVSKGSAATQGWLVDSGGEVIAEQDYDQRSQEWKLKIRRDGHWQEGISGHDPIDTPRILGFGPTEDTLLMQAVEREDPVWRLLSLKDGTLGAPMVERRQLSIPIEDLSTRLIGGVRIEDDAHYVFFEPAIQARWDAVIHAFPGERVGLVSTANSFSRFVVRVDGANDGYVYEFVDLDSHAAISLGEVYSGVGTPLEVRRITYAASDGLQIPAYLTLPRARAAKNLPLIVLTHGGPAARVTADFNWWAQALADQNYAVLEPNYRGSDLDRRFLAAGFGEWGRKMQTDLSDGVRYLVNEGIVDPARVCIVGASYGGYAALAGVTLDPGVYRCAIAVAGISDLKRWLEWVNARHLHSQNVSQRYWDRFMGVSGPSDPILDTISPIKHLAGVNVPVLLIHGRDDTVVPFEQSRVMFDALRHEKKDVEFVTLQHEDHWLSRSETRLQMLQASVAFLRAHNSPD
jgi:dipeptidyl aminopeptidase/acylaminoacyl peptidase